MTRAAQPPTEPTAHLPKCREYPTGWLCEAACQWQPTAERAGDADDVATVLASALQSDEATDIPRYEARRLAQHLAAALAARPAAVPDRDENLRTAIEVVADRIREMSVKQASAHNVDGSVTLRWAEDQIRAVLGDSSGALAEHDAKVLRDALAGITTHNGKPVSPENLRWAATHEALCRSYIFDVLTGLADRLAADTGATT